MKRTLTIAAALTLGVAAWMPSAAMAQVGLSLYVDTAPPAPRYESIPAPRSGYVWAPGYWNWDGGRHVWIAGHWETARNGYEFRRSEWVRDNDRWRLERGGWREVGYRDRDYDVIRVAPPPPRYERVPRARPGYYWVPGHWVWRGNRHEWIRGDWVRARPGYVYAPPRWVERNGGWYMDQGRWERGGRDRDRDGIPDRMERRDGDRDGVPDAYDRDRDNDGTPNRYDRDRDGDGVRNEVDRRPDNRRID